MRTGFPTCDSKAIFFLVFVSFLGLLCTPSHILLTCVDEISRRIEGGANTGYGRMEVYLSIESLDNNVLIQFE
jgi:hypothetical protein